MSGDQQESQPSDQQPQSSDQPQPNVSESKPEKLVFRKEDMITMQFSEDQSGDVNIVEFNSD